MILKRSEGISKDYRMIFCHGSIAGRIVKMQVTTLKG